MFRKLLIANRGEIALRVIRTARRLGITTVAVYSDADAKAWHVAMADEAYRIGGAAASESYLDQQAIIAVAVRAGAEAIHPGYGFLAENPDFAEVVSKAGLVFVGPPPQAIRAMGHKNEAKRLMEKAKVPLLPGYHGADQTLARLAKEAERIGYPVLLKPVAGGGGKGMRRVAAAAELQAQAEAAQREAGSAFGDDRLLIEKYLDKARHIEVQIMADGHGHVLHLFERDCSLQRRHQKVIEEAPAPGLTAEMRETMCAAAIAAAKSVGYVGAGTVEFIADVSAGLRPDRFYFMEMNTRLQVEHPVTEMITGLDLVEWQLRVAAGEKLPFRQSEISLAGHAIEARLYAEDPERDFQPQTGRLSELAFPDEPYLRTDLGVRAGDVITPYYDPMIGKLIVHAPSRDQALARLADVLARGRISGCRTNLGFLNRLARLPEVQAGNIDTGLIARSGVAHSTASAPPIEAIAAALLFGCGHLERSRDQSPFHTLTGFRLWGGEARRLDIRCDGAALACTLARADHGFVAAAGDRTLNFKLLDWNEDGLRLDCGDHVAALSWFHHDGRLETGVDGAQHAFSFDDQSHGVADGDGGDLVIAPTPGQVRKLCVTAGEQVERGTTIAIVEAMKMEFALKAERAGRIAAIHVSEGSQISEGTVVAVIGDGNG